MCESKVFNDQINFNKINYNIKMDFKALFTTDEELAMLEHRDATTNIVGYVQTITAPVPAGKSNETLFKFTLSNGNKTIFILIWSTDLINKYHKDILPNRIIDISGGYCKAAVLTRYQENNNFVPFEIIVKEYTEITFIGFYETRGVSKERQKVTFDTLYTVEGLVGSLVIVVCDTMNDVDLDSEAPRLAPELIQKGGRPVKRIH